ncbi:MAG: hypothetical protein VXX97_08890, partial [Pseudomonadota bacterium]|nr:hypothetical protein [Pseudomonadota bacterium]
ETETWDGYEYPGIATIREQLECFADDCKGGDPYPVTPDQILHATRILDAVIKSIETGARCTVD